MALLCTGCDTSSSESSPEASPRASLSASPTGSPTGTPTLPECTRVVAAGANLANSLRRLADGQATAAEVRAEADQLVDTVRQAQPAVSAVLRAQLQRLESALVALRQELEARPVSLDAVRAAGEDAGRALLGLATPCSSATSTSGTTS